MALIKCNECLSQVSTNAATCPQCGNKIQKKTSLFIWLFIIVVGYIVWGKVFSLSTSSYRNYPSNANQKTSQVDPLQELKNAQPSTLEPYGELAEMFNYGSDYTDLQREIKLKEIRGKVIAWRLPVYEINRYENDYKIQTSSHFKSENIFLQGKEIVNTFVYVTPRNDEDRRLIENLKTGDVVAIKGIVGDDTTMRSLNIKPAILDGYEVSAPVALQAANSPEETEVVKETAQIDAPTSTSKVNADAEHVVSNNNGLVMNMLAAKKYNDIPQFLSLQAEINSLPKRDRGDRKLAREKNKLGLAAFHSGDFAKAIILFNEGANADPGDVELVDNHGYALMMNGQLDEAKSKLIEAITMKVSRGAAWGNLGQVFAKQGDKDSAVACFKITFVFSSAPEKSVAYFTDLAKSDSDSAVREAAQEALDSYSAPTL